MENPHQDTSPTILKSDDTLIDNQLKIANIFNYYFLTVADASMGNINNGVYPTTDNPINYLSKYYNKTFPMIQWQYISTYEIKNIIKSLKSKNTCGYDEISNRVIKLSSPFIISPLTYICNAVLKSGVFPDRLKYAIVKPIHKKGSKTDISNYRPISILTSFPEIFEKIIYNSGFGGLGVACWPLVPKFAGSNPAEAVGFLGAKKSSARLPSEGK